MNEIEWLNPTVLRYYDKERTKLVEYSGACLAPFFPTGIYKTPKETFYIEYPIGQICKNRNILIDPRYIELLKSQGFRGIDTEKYEAAIDETFTYLEWVSTFTVMRYLLEEFSLVTDFVNKTIQYPHYDPWLVFLALHHSVGCMNFNHSLLSSCIERVVIPQKQFEQWRKTPDKTFSPKIVGIHDIWGSKWRYEDKHREFNDEYQRLVTLQNGK